MVLLLGKKIVFADSNDLAYVKVCVADDEGRIVPDATVRLKMIVEGDGILLASGNATPDNMRSFRNPVCSIHLGKCLAILQPGTKSGTMRLKVVTKGILTVETEIRIASVECEWHLFIMSKTISTFSFT